MSAAVNARCMTPTCPWVGRVRPVRVDTIGLGAGLFGRLLLMCECGSEPEVEVVAMAEPAATTRPLDRDRPPIGSRGP